MEFISISELVDPNCEKLLIDTPIDECVDKIRSIKSDSLRNIYITENSKVKDISFLKKFVNLETVNLSTKKVVGLEALNCFNKLKGLILDIKDKNRCLEVLSKNIKLEYFALRFFSVDDFNNLEKLKISSDYFGVLGKVQLIDRIPIKNVKEMKIQNVIGLESVSNITVPKLKILRSSSIKSFGPSKIERLTIESCNNFDLKSLNKVDGLRRLTLRSINEIRDWTFLKNDSLKTVLGEAIKKVSGLDKLRLEGHIKGLCINKFPNSFIQSLSDSFPDVFLSNNSLSLYKNKEVDFDYDLFEDNL